MKMAIETIRRSLVPTRALSQPEAMIITVVPSTKAVATQEIWSGAAEKVPCMCGSAMATTKMSRT